MTQLVSAQDKMLKALEPYKNKINHALSQSLSLIGASGELREACEYSLLGAGKRFRPALVLMIAEALGGGKSAELAACAIEYFHTASLIVDDLPCMDNDEMRRGMPTLHCKFGETMALLASYALIAGGYELIARNAKAYGGGEIALLALECASKNTGFLGATGGQYLDIYPPTLCEEMVREVFQKKTGALFEIAFVFGWLFGGGSTEQLDLVRKASSHFGMAFQIADDLGDVKQDSINGRKINFVTLLGTGSAIEMFHVERSLFCETLEMLGLSGSQLTSLSDYLEHEVMSF